MTSGTSLLLNASYVMTIAQSEVKLVFFDICIDCGGLPVVIWSISGYRLVKANCKPSFYP